jgi:hypothetical protein
MMLSKLRWPPAAILILLEFHYNKTTEAKHLKLCTGMPYYYISRPAQRHGTFCHLVANFEWQLLIRNE